MANKIKLYYKHSPQVNERTIEQRLDEIEQILSRSLARGEAYDAKFDAYQKASNLLINLAFALIVTAISTIVISAVTGG